MTAMTADDFEAKYRADADPWNYLGSEYERSKYEATLAACGPGPFSAALELGGSIGVFSGMLAPRCEHLTTVDFSPTAVRCARARLADHPNVTVLLGAIPDTIPADCFELVVASEILYYLDQPTLDATLAALEHRLAPGGRLVCVHWRPDGPERPFSAAEVHAIVCAQPWLAPAGSAHTDEYLLDFLDHR